ncbi:MAG: hypothetical protein IPM54_43625 [Polyangiaceae bacterium]|nr:hypothetical protein [Polyangiaceae bacterium]
MAFWSAADVEIASRIITAKTRNERRVRGKLTLHFSDPQTQSDADQAADRCASLAEEIISEASDHQHILEFEGEFISALRRRLPIDIPPVRSIDLAGLHVIGDPSASSGIRRSTASFRAVVPPVSASSALAPTQAPPPPPIPNRTPGSSPAHRASNTPPSSMITTGPMSRAAASSKRPTFSRMRAMTPAMVLPPGSPPLAIARVLAPFMSDCASRILVGFLRAYDLHVLRGLALEDGSAEMLAAVVPVSDAPLGGYEASRTAELTRWQNSFGQATFQRLRRECQVVAVFFAHTSLLHQDIPQNITLEILQEATPMAFAGDASILLGMSRWLSLKDEEVLPALCAHLTDLVGHGNPHELASALSLLVASVNEDLVLASSLAKDAVGM